jgi:serine/threonine protein kinase
VLRLFGGVTKADIENEVRAVKKLSTGSHTNIVQVFHLGQMRSNSTFYYIDMELCDISLGHYMQGKRTCPCLPLSWDYFRNDLKNICVVYNHIVDGLIFIHSNDEVHRDLTPQNSISHVLRS